MNFDALYLVVATLMLIIAVGFICRKVGIINDVSSKNLSRLVLMVGQPAMLIYSMSSAEYNTENVKIAWTMLWLGFLYHAVLAVLGYFLALPYKKNIDEEKISEFSIMFANCAFIGFPIFEALLGPTGLFMASFSVFSFNVLLWTWGLAIFGRKRNDIKLNIKKIIFNFGTIPCVIGFALYLLKDPAIGFELPLFITKAAGYLTNICTPISVLIIGALIATQSPKRIFSSWKLYYFNAIKLFVLPLLVCLISKVILILVPVDGLYMYAVFATAAAALPSAAAVTMMSETHGLDSGYSSVIVGTTSLMSVLSLPIVMMIAEAILKM